MKGHEGFRRLTQADVQKILEKHLEWLESGGEKGAQAVFGGFDLSDASFRKADLRDADFRHTEGLALCKLAGADLSGAKLPEPLNQFDLLETLEEASRNARQLFFTMLLACLYAVLTVAATNDVQLLTNSSSAALPVVGAPIRIAGFYAVGPLLILALYVYFLLHLQRLFEGLADLPAVFPDGRPLDQVAYPWPVVGLVRGLCLRLHERRLPLYRVQAALAVALTWAAVPLTLLVIWYRYLSRHDRLMTCGLHVPVLLITTVFGLMSGRLVWITFRGKAAEESVEHHSRATRGWNFIAVTALALLVVFGGLSYLILNGVPPYVYTDTAIYGGHHPPMGFWNPRRMLPWGLEEIRLNPFADFREKDVSEKPANWAGEEENEKEMKTRETLVKGATLRNSNLPYVRGFRAFLVYADLRDANLDWADLQEAHLDGAFLQGASLKNAVLKGTDLRQAALDRADFSNADLSSANLCSADVCGADFTGAKGLKKEQVRKAKHWCFAVYDQSFSLELGICAEIQDEIRKRRQKREIFKTCEDLTKGLPGVVRNNSVRPDSYRQGTPQMCDPVVDAEARLPVQPAADHFHSIAGCPEVHQAQPATAMCSGR